MSGAVAIYAPPSPRAPRLGHAARRLAEELGRIGYRVSVYAAGALDPAGFDPGARRVALVSTDAALFERPLAARVRMLWPWEPELGPQPRRRLERIDWLLPSRAGSAPSWPASTPRCGPGFAGSRPRSTA